MVHMCMLPTGKGVNDNDDDSVKTVIMMLNQKKIIFLTKFNHPSKQIKSGRRSETTYA